MGLKNLTENKQFSPPQLRAMALYGANQSRYPSPWIIGFTVAVRIRDARIFQLH